MTHRVTMPTNPRRWLLAALFLAASVPAAAATPLALDTYAVSTITPGGGGYVPSQVVVDVAGSLTLLNADIRAHDLVAVADGPADNAWCDRYPGRDCPLFASPLAGLGEQAVVEGTEQLAPGDSYEFYCTIHPWMRGTLTAL